MESTHALTAKLFTGSRQLLQLTVPGSGQDPPQPSEAPPHLPVQSGVHTLHRPVVALHPLAQSCPGVHPEPFALQVLCAVVELQKTCASGHTSGWQVPAAQ